MSAQTCLVRLPGSRNFAIISPRRIAFTLDASSDEVEDLCRREDALANLDATNCPGIENSPEPATGNASVALITTFDCNLRCVYCYARGGETQEYMSLDLATRAMRAVGRMKGYKLLDLYLVGGGEPLLNFSMVQAAVDFAKALYQEVVVHVVTNGTFGEEVLTWLVAQKADVRVSYDGIAQEKQRPHVSSANRVTGDTVKANIRELVRGGASVTVQSIITAASLDTMGETVGEVANLGVKVIKFEPALATGVSRGSPRLVPNPVMYARALIAAIGQVVRQGLPIKVDTGFFSEPGDGYYCGISTGNLVITPQGLITACVEVARPSDAHSDLIMYGRVVGGDLRLDKAKIGSLKTLDIQNAMGGCNECNLRLICRGGCPMANIWESGLPYSRSKYTCAVEHALVPPLLLSMAQVPTVASIVSSDAEVRVC